MSVVVTYNQMCEDQTIRWKQYLKRHRRRHTRIIYNIVSRCIPKNYTIDRRSYAINGIDRNIIYAISLNLARVYPSCFSQKRIDKIKIHTVLLDFDEDRIAIGYPHSTKKQKARSHES